MDHEHHGFDYIELIVDDLAGAQRFYGAAFGFTFNAYGPGYAGIVVNGREVGGLATLDGVTPSASSAAPGAVSPLVILYSNNLDATLEAVRDAGGTVTTPPYDFPGGRRFHFADPAGNNLAVWTATG
ncbi:MAG TPA: VOC family protein [Myxococcota bacterium]